MNKRDYNRCRQLEEQVAAYIDKQQMINTGDRVLIGLSGGADSVCLFYVLLALRERLDFSLEAVHVNHMLRASAQRDENYVTELCHREGILLHAEHVDVAALADKEGMTLEEAGRSARYGIFRRLARDGGVERAATKIAVAHHANDQAETILFHLCRGTGLEGMAGMRPVREEIIRPLLCLERKDIAEYLELRGIAYMTDETNADNSYSRNMLRNCVLPQLTESICSGTVTHISHTGEVIAEANDYLQGQIREAYESCICTESTQASLRLDMKPFQNLHPYLQKEVIRLAVSRICGSKKDISEVHVKAVMKLLTTQTGSSSDLPYGIKVSRSYDYLVFRQEQRGDRDGDGATERGGDSRSFIEIIREQLEPGNHRVRCILKDGRVLTFRVIPYDKNADIPRNPYTKWLDYDKIEKPLLVRTPEEGDFFYFNDKNRKSVKDYMVNEKIPLRDRDQTMLVMSGNHMLYFPGKRISNYYKVDNHTTRVLEIRLQEDKTDG